MIKTLANAILILSLAVGAMGKGPAKLKAEVTHLPEDCDIKAEDGDRVKVHYTGKLEADGTTFDSSYDRGSPLPFKLGAGQVISGWDHGIEGMCVGEKRVLTIPPELAYGDAGAGATIRSVLSVCVDITHLIGDREAGHAIYSSSSPQTPGQSGVIPPGATLIFETELVSVDKA